MKTEITDLDYITAAKNKHEVEGTCEIDTNAQVSRSSDGGAYVQAWVWVYDNDAEDAVKIRN